MCWPRKGLWIATKAPPPFPTTGVCARAMPREKHRATVAFGDRGKGKVTKNGLLTAIFTCLRFGLAGGCGGGIPVGKGWWYPAHSGVHVYLDEREVI